MKFTPGVNLPQVKNHWSTQFEHGTQSKLILIHRTDSDSIIFQWVVAWTTIRWKYGFAASNVFHVHKLRSHRPKHTTAIRP